MIYKILVLLLIIQHSVYAQDPEQLLNEANEQMSKGDLVIADSLLKESLKVDPSFAPAFVAQSKIWLRKGEIKKAIIFGEKAVKIDEEFRTWANELSQMNRKLISGMEFFKNRQTDKAISELESIVENYPYFVQPYYNMAIIKYKTKDPEGMAFYAKKILSYNPNHKKGKKLFDNAIKYFYKIGNESYKRGDIEKAEANFLKSLEYDNNFIPAYYQLGVIEKKMGNSYKSKKYFNKLLSIDSLHHKTLFTLGALYESINSLDSALFFYEKSIRANPTFIKPYSSLGNIYVLEKEFELAKQILMEGKLIDPEYSKIYVTLGYAFSEEAKLLEEESFLPSLEPQEKMNLLDKSSISYKKASENLEIASELDKNNYEVWYRYAAALNSIKEYGKASEAAQKCIDLKRKYGGGNYEKGVALFGLNKKERALKFLEDANKDRNFRKLAQRKIDEIKRPSKYEK